MHATYLSHFILTGLITMKMLILEYKYYIVWYKDLRHMFIT
jgi:hypothetical protein